MQSPRILPFKFVVLLVTTSVALTAYASAASEKVLTFMNPAIGTQPGGELVFDATGNLYGTAATGGLYGFGTVFELQPISTGGWKKIVVHNFAGTPDGDTPYGPLVFDSAGNLYGITTGGGSQGFGTVFEVSPSSKGWTETVIYSFQGGSNGKNPQSGLVFDSAGNLYGVTGYGGQANAGIAFKLTPGSSGWTESVIYSFGSFSSDGIGPVSTLVFDGKGNLYGTTVIGGVGKHGTVFELSPSSQGWTEKVIQSFWAGNAGAGVIFDNAGNLYGAAYAGGRTGFGYVYKLAPSGGGWIKTNIHQFSGEGDGRQPLDRLAFSAGKLYGTTQVGGGVGLGVVFEMSPTSSGSWQEKVLHFFLGGRDGVYPATGVILDKSGNLYGTTPSGGRLDDGVVYEVTP